MMIPKSTQKCTAGHPEAWAYYYDKCLDEVRLAIIENILDIIKKHPMFPVIVSQQLFKEIIKFRDEYILLGGE